MSHRSDPLKEDAQKLVKIQSVLSTLLPQGEQLQQLQQSRQQPTQQNQQQLPKNGRRPGLRQDQPIQKRREDGEATDQDNDENDNDEQNIYEEDISGQSYQGYSDQQSRLLQRMRAANASAQGVQNETKAQWLARHHEGLLTQIKTFIQQTLLSIHRRQGRLDDQWDAIYRVTDFLSLTPQEVELLTDAIKKVQGRAKSVFASIWLATKLTISAALIILTIVTWCHGNISEVIGTVGTRAADDLQMVGSDASILLFSNNAVSLYLSQAESYVLRELSCGATTAESRTKISIQRCFFDACFLTSELTDYVVYENIHPCRANPSCTASSCLRQTCEPTTCINSEGLCGIEGHRCGQHLEAVNNPGGLCKCKLASSLRSGTR